MSSYKFRILIDTKSNSDIFRDIVISSTDNFETFYHAIIESFSFSGDQLGSFYVSNDSWDKGNEIALMDMGFGNELERPLLMKDTPIASIIESKGQKLILVYDFLKMWCFLIELVELIPTSVEEPAITLSIGSAPLEESKEVDTTNTMGQTPDLGNDIDDIFSDFEDDNDYEGFENIDDFDI